MKQPESRGASRRGLPAAESTTMEAIPELDGGTYSMVFDERPAPPGKVNAAKHRRCILGTRPAANARSERSQSIYLLKPARGLSTRNGMKACLITATKVFVRLESI